MSADTNHALAALIERALAGEFTPKEMAAIAREHGRPRSFSDRTVQRWRKARHAVYSTDTSNRTHWYLTEAGRLALGGGAP